MTSADDAEQRIADLEKQVADARRIAGHKSDEIEAILGWSAGAELIHRDDLALLANGNAAAS